MLEGKKTYNRLSDESKNIVDKISKKFNIKNNESIFLILNNLEEPQYCKNKKHCNNYTKLARGPLRYREFCSIKCKNTWFLENTNIKEKISKKTKENEKKFKESGEKYIQARKRLKTLENNNKIIPLNLKPSYEQYKTLVLRETRKNNLKVLENYDKRGRADLKNVYYHLDHKFSIKEGFKNNILPCIIGSIYNLEFIPGDLNSSKQSKCSISLELLMEKFYE